MRVFTFELQRFTGESVNNVLDNIQITGTASLDEFDVVLNDAASKIITLTEDNDKYENRVSDVTIQALGGDDSIQNEGNNASIDAGTGDDSIGTHGDNVTINAGAGDNTVENSGGRFSYIAGKNLIITALGGNDFILNRHGGSNALINAGEGDNTVENGNGENVTINTGSGNDSIENYGDKASINAGEGDNTVKNGDGSYGTSGRNSNNVTINTGDGNDSIYSYGSNVTINAGNGDNTIVSDSHRGGGNNVTITSGSGDDSIKNHNSDTSINASDGNDYIYNYGSNVTIEASDGHDFVDNRSDSVTIDAGAGDDSIENYGSSDALINANDGDDYIYSSHSSYVTINTGAGDDTIISDDYSKSVIINAGEGNDSVSNSGDSVTIDGGIGDDSIHNSGSNVSISGGAGNDTVENSYSYYLGKYLALNVTIETGDGDDLITNDRGEYALINAGTGDDTITISGYDSSISAGEGNDSVSNSGDSVTIDGGIGDDSIHNGGYRVTINAGTGNDSIFNDSGNDTIDAGAGDDTITNDSYGEVSINAGTGNDVIYVTYGSGVTINGGSGDDRISINSSYYYYTRNNLIEYTAGGGNDTVWGFNGDDTLKIGNGTGTYSTTKSGDDIIVTVGDGKISLVGAASLSAVNISGKKTDTTPVDTTTLTVTNSTKSPVTIGSSVKTVDASTRTKAVKITGNDLNNTIIGGTKNDTLNGAAGDDKLTGGKGSDVFIYGGGNDTVTDYATGDKISLNASIKSFGANGNDFVFNFEDGSLTLTDAADKKISVTSGKVTNVYSDKGIFNTAGTAVTLNASATNYTADKTVVTIDAGLTSGVEITGNTKANKILLGDGDDVVIWLAKGGNDTLYNFGADDLLSVVGAVSDGSVKSGNTYLKIGSNKITVKDSSQVTFADNDGTRIFDGGIFYDENKISATLGSAVKEFDSTDTDVVDITGNAKANKFVASSTDTTLTGGKGNDTFVHTGGNDFITDYGNGSDKISLGAASIESFSVTDGNVNLDLDKGSITIANGAGKKISLVSGKKTTANIFTDKGIFDTSGKSVTLNASTETFTADSKVVTIDASSTSGATITGNSKANKVYLGDENIFVWSQGGNDTLMNFGADDLLSVVGAVSDGSISGGNSIIKIGSNKITVKDSSQVTFADNDGTKIFDGGIFYDTEKTSATLASATKDFDATDTEIISVTGNDKANKLYAGDENTTLAGGKGNDSLWGGNGADTFIYDKGDGKDIIYGFDDNDLLEIHGLNGSVTGKFNAAGTELTVKVGSTDVSVLKDFGSTTTFNVTANGIAHQITK